MLEMSLDTFLGALPKAGCGLPHLIFANGAYYDPPESRAELDREVLDELGALGLVRGRELVEDFEDLLHTLDQPHTEYYAFVRSGDAQYSALVAARGRLAAIALHRNGTVWLQHTNDRDLTGTLATHLAEAEPAEFTPFSVRQDELDSPRSPEARELAAVLDDPWHGLGYLHVARRPGGGARVEAEPRLGYFDSSIGRIGIEISGPPGNQYLNLFPGEPERLATKLAALRDTLD